MAKPKITKGKEIKKEEAPQKKTPTFEKEEEQERKGILPEDIDFRRGMRCG